MSPKIIQLDPKTKALQIRSGADDSEIHLGSIADAQLFLLYNGWTYVAYSHWNPGNDGVLLSERMSGIPLHKLNLLEEREAFFDEFVAGNRQSALCIWIRLDDVYHVKRLSASSSTRCRMLFFLACNNCVLHNNVLAADKRHHCASNSALTLKKQVLNMDFRKQNSIYVVPPQRAENICLPVQITWLQFRAIILLFNRCRAVGIMMAGVNMVSLF